MPSIITPINDSIKEQYDEGPCSWDETPYCPAEKNEPQCYVLTSPNRQTEQEQKAWKQYSSARIVVAASYRPIAGVSLNLV